MLHFYVHYLRIKGFKVFLNKNVERQLNNICHSCGKNHNNISHLVQVKKKQKGQVQGKGQKGSQPYHSHCINFSKNKPTIISTEEFKKLEFNIGYKLRSLNLKTVSIYGNARFCCINMEYCIHQGRGNNSELINI